MHDDNYFLIGADFTEIFSPQSTIAIVETNDEIGAILRIHLILEKFLNLWCNKVTGYDDFFDFDNRVQFSLKLKIAKKFGLDSDVASFIKTFNKMRNDLAHKINHVLHNDNLESLRHVLNNMPSYGEKPIPNIEDPSWKGEIDGRVIYWNNPDNSELDKLILIYFTFSMKTLDIFVNDLEEKGIAVAYKE